MEKTVIPAKDGRPAVKRMQVPHDHMSESKRLAVENNKLYIENMQLRQKLKASGVDIINIAYTYVVRILFIIFGGFIALELLYMLENALGL